VEELGELADAELGLAQSQQNANPPLVGEGFGEKRELFEGERWITCIFDHMAKYRISLPPPQAHISTPPPTPSRSRVSRIAAGPVRRPHSYLAPTDLNMRTFSKALWTATLIHLALVWTPAPGLAKDFDLQQLNATMRALNARVEVSVVQVFASGYHPEPGDPTSLYTRRQSTGSGAILDPDGYIVTNAHVVRGARQVHVLLPAPPSRTRNERSILKARGELLRAEIISVDSETDLAILKIARSGLPYLELANSDLVRKGELVFAFGSPLGLENSVTMGIVSATARQLTVESPMIYIQTDAAVNPGNSGGPLVNIQGQVIGINTLILSQTGTNQGVGFAAPSNIVRNVYQEIREHGVVRRGQIGVHAQTLSPALAQGLNLARDWGVVLGDVYPGSPAERAGLRPGDIVLTLSGKTMENARQLHVNLYLAPIGHPVQIEILRGTITSMRRVEVIARSTARAQITDFVNPDEDRVPALGILGMDLDPEIMRLFGRSRRDHGVIVAAIFSEITAWGDGFQQGDIIYEINGEEIRSLSDLRNHLTEVVADVPCVVHLERDGQLHYLAFQLGD
jgi:serine protease Do